MSGGIYSCHSGVEGATTDVGEATSPTTPNPQQRATLSVTLGWPKNEPYRMFQYNSRQWFPLSLFE